MKFVLEDTQGFFFGNFLSDFVFFINLDRKMEQHNMHIFFAGIVLMFIWTLDSGHVSGYNIETEKIGLVTGPSGSQFGYSVAFVNAPGWTDKLLRLEKVDKV